MTDNAGDEARIDGYRDFKRIDGGTAAGGSSGGGPPPLSVPSGGGASPPKKGHRLAVAIGIVAIMALIAAGVFVSRRAETPSASPPPPATAVTPAVEACTPPVAARPTRLDEASAPRNGGVLRVGIPEESDGWDPTARGFGASSYLIASAIFDPLAIFDEQGEVQPFLADSIEPNADYTEYSIHLHPAVRFHDGTSLDAEAVRANFELSRRKGSLAAPSYTAIDDISVLGALTVVVTMNQPWPMFPVVLTGQFGYIEAPTVVGTDKGLTQPVGTGPFSYVDWVPAEKMTVKKNPTYWNNERTTGPHVDQITFIPNPDERARAVAMTNHELDLNLSSDVSRIAALQTEAQQSKASIGMSTQSITYVVLNTSTTPFSDPDARLALAYLTDQGDIVRSLGSDLRRQISSPFPSESPWCVSDTGYRADNLTEATRLVKVYEQRAGKPLTMDLTYANGADGENVAAILRDRWSNAGVVVKPKAFDKKSFVLNLVGGNYSAGIFSQVPPRDPDMLYTSLHTAGATETATSTRLNMSRLSDPAVDKALDSGRTTTDIAARKLIYGDMTRALNQALPAVWLYSSPQIIVAASNVSGTAGLLSPQRQLSRPWAADVWLNSLP